MITSILNQQPQIKPGSYQKNLNYYCHKLLASRFQNVLIVLRVSFALSKQHFVYG